MKADCLKNGGHGSFPVTPALAVAYGSGTHAKMTFLFAALDMHDAGAQSALVGLFTLESRDIPRYKDQASVTSATSSCV